MKKLIVILALVLAVVFSASAQEGDSEFFAGYSYFRGDLDANFNGFNLAYTRFLGNKVGFTSELSRLYCPEEDARVVTYLFGPRYVVNRQGAVSPFVHALVGGGSLNVRSSNANGFAFALGGGIDIKLSKRVSFRAFQVDYLPIRLSGETFQNGRVSAGVSFKF